MARPQSIRFSLLLLISFTFAALAGCTDDPIYPEKAIAVSVTKLPPVEEDLYYELWISYPSPSAKASGRKLDHGDATYISVGAFRVDAAGVPTDLNGGPVRFAIPGGFNPNLIVDTWLSVERESVPHTTPGRVLLAGPFGGTAGKATATLVASDGEAFGEKLSVDSTDWCLLQAATSNAPEDSVSGIWFVRFTPSIGVPGGFDTAAGLSLAAQPLNPDNPDWNYQSWLVRYIGTPQAEYIPMGSFSSPGNVDADGAGPGAGPITPVPFRAPGEDFTTGPHRVLNDGTYSVAVAIQPDGIALTRPFYMIRQALIPAGLTARTLILLTSMSSEPKVEVTVDR